MIKTGYKFIRCLKLRFLVPLFVYATYLFCHKQTDGFQITKVISSIPSEEKWEMPQLEASERKELEELLSHPFSYLDKGGQSYAFLSEDGKTVLKLFKMSNIRQYPYLYHIALPGILDQLRIKVIQQQRRKLDRLFNSSAMAYKELKEATGLIYLNLNHNPDFKDLQVTVIDKLGIAHHLSLDTIPFALQKRVKGAGLSLKECLKKQQIAEAKKIVEQMVYCLKERHEKGIIDIDPAIKRNMGLSDTRAIFMDIGAFFHSNNPLTEEDLIKETRDLHYWIKKRSRELAIYMDTLIHEPGPEATAF